MMELLTLTVSALLWPTFGYARINDEGCFVKDKMHFDDFPTRSVKFTAFTPPSGIIFKAKMKCGNGDFAADTLSVSKNEVTMMRYDNSLNSTKKCWPGPTTEAVWTDFDLKFGDAYEILNGQGQSLISERISPKCLVKEVEILNGSFIRQCSEGIAKWEVHEGQCALVPLFLFEGENLLNLTLTSKDKFRPVFHIGEQTVKLGMKNRTFVVSENDSAFLPPSSLSVPFSVEKNDSFISCTIKTDGLVLTKVNLEREPRHVKVCAEGKSKFLLMLPMKTTVDAKDNATYTYRYKFWILFGGLVISASTAAAFIFLYCHLYCQKNTQGDSSRETPQESAESPYLEPRAIRRMESPDSRVSPCSSPEHIYEEVDEVDFGHVNENSKV